MPHIYCIFKIIYSYQVTTNFFWYHKQFLYNNITNALQILATATGAYNHYYDDPFGSFAVFT